MKILVFPSHQDLYNSITIDTDSLEQTCSIESSEQLPVIYIDDLISDLISEN